MIGKEYQNHKKNVIDLFKGYKKSRGDFDDGVDLKHLQSRVDALVNGKFILSVAGEVKAGKSTFINALLGAEILPSDVLQASSAVVEIFKHESSVLKVKFASGKEETLLNDLNTPDIDEAKDRLHEICRLHDDYRDIPTTLIDACIVHSDDLPNVDGEFIAQLEKNSSENLKNKQAKIASYVSTRTKDKIPVEISFGYPLKWDFDELRIVDTPGVNATGGVQETAHKYFEAANAILFVHPIKPIESRSFRKFVESVISNRSKETLFLILTHAGLYPGDEIVRLQAEAGRLYEGLIPENRILVVDSLLKLIHCDLDKGVSVGEIRKSENKKKILSSYREQAEDEDRNLIDVVLEASRFENMLSTIDEFSMKAPSIQLQEILEKIKSGYEKQEELINENIKNLEIQKKDPQKFEQELDRIQKALEKYRLLTRATQEDLNSNYSGRHSSWQQDIDILKVKYPELITGSDSVESVRKHTVDAMNAIQSKVDDFSKELTNRLENALIKAGKSFNKEHQISIPKVDLAALEEKANKLAYKEIDKNEIHLERRWYTLWLKKHETVRCVGKEKVFDNEKFLSEYKTECNKQFYDIVNDLPNKSKIVLDLYLDNFRKEMDSIIESRQNALDKEKNKKRSNNEIIEDIKALSKKRTHPPRTKAVQRNTGGYALLNKNIKTDISEEFSNLKKSLQVYLQPNYDVRQAKKLLQTHVPKEVIYKTEILLDTLLNYLMTDAREKIKSADTELQNAFFDMDFRKRIHEWAKQLQNKLELEPDSAKYSTDPRLRSGLIASGITFLAGASITAAVDSGIVGSIVSGITTIFLAAIAFKIAYDKASHSARKTLETDVDQYLERAQQQVFAWLETVADAFDNDFHAFCTANGFILNGEDGE